MKASRVGVLTFVGLSVLGSLTLGVSMPASAAGFPPITPVAFHDLTDYAVTISQQQLIELQGKTAAGKAANGAWESTLGRAAAQDAGLYSVATQYGNLPPETIGEVIPLTKKIGNRMFGKLSPRLGGIPRPSFPTFAKSAFRIGPVSAGLATVGLVAWDNRAQIAGGVASWFGVDATGAVCTNAMQNGNQAGVGFVNWVTGQDCNAFTAARDYAANVGVTPGVGSLHQCMAADPSSCVWVTGVSTWDNGVLYSPSWGPRGYQMPLTCFTTSGRGGYPYRILTADGQSLSMGSSNGPGWAPFATNGCGDDPAENNLAWSGFAPQPSSPITGFQLEQGSPVTVVSEKDQDPEWRLMCQLYGSSGNVTVGYTAPIRESVIKTNGFPPPVCTPLAATDVGTRIVVTQIDGGPSVVIKDDSEMATAAPARARDAAAQCDMRTCIYDVVRQSDLVSCFGLGDQCTDWFTDPNRETNYKCEYGGDVVDSKNCYVYANTFNSAKRAAGDPYADPLDGKDPLGGNAPTAGSQLMNNPVRSPDSFRDCAGGTMDISKAFILIGRSIQCGLEWAFVPSDISLASDAISIKDSWARTAPGQVFTAVGAWNLNFGVSGCAGVPFPFTYTTRSGSATTDMGLPSACPGTALAPFAGWIRNLGAFGFVIGAAFAVRKNAAASIDFHAGA